MIGTPDDLVAAIEQLQQITGGFGVVLGFAHDWANRENSRRSWDMVARYVIPALNGSLRPMQASADYVEANKAELIGGASAAVLDKILAHEGAAAAMATTMAQMAQRAAAREAKKRRACERPGLPSGRRPTRPDVSAAGSVVLQRHGVGRDVDLRLVFGDLDDSTFAEVLGAKFGATRLARTVEPLADDRTATRAGERNGVAHPANAFLSIVPANAPVCSPWSMNTWPLTSV